MDTRPTPDRLRESLFSILAPELEGRVFVDAYAGTGAVGIEALSRGASRVILIERSKPAAAVIRENLKSLGIGPARAEVVQGRVLQYLAQRRGDIVFLDPPYELDAEYTQALDLLGAEPPSLVIAQHAWRRPLGDAFGLLHKTRVVRQGDNSLSFYRPQTDSNGQTSDE